MRIASIATLALAAAVALPGLVPGAAQAQDQRSYILATATTGGTYYPVGVALATLAKVRLQASEGIDMSAISSAGSAENIKLMREDEAQFSILQGLFGLYARDGTGPIEADGPQENVRSVALLWPNVEHFIVRAPLVDTGTIDDLKGLAGERFVIGARNSGTEFSSRFLLQNLGIDPESFDLVFQGYGPSVDGMINGTIAFTNPAAGPPVSVVTRAFAQMGNDVRGLSFTDEQLTRADAGTGLYYRYVIPAGTYPGLDEDWETVAQPNFLAVNADVPEEDVYLITKTIYENLGFLRNIHAATGEMNIDNAISGLPLPLHPGAARYYAEVGLDVPDRLIAD